jgi:hypothetical protein
MVSEVQESSIQPSPYFCYCPNPTAGSWSCQSKYPSLPMNSTSLLSLAIIATFKSWYTHPTFCTILDAGKDDTFFSIIEL